MVEKILTIVLGFFVTVFVARYLGPKEYGVLSYAISLVTLVAVAGHMGLNGLVVREILNNPNQRGKTIGTAIVLKFLGVMIGFGVLLIYAVSYEEKNGQEFLVLMILGSMVFFKPLDVVNSWFEAFLQAKYGAISRIFSLVVASALKVLFVFLGLGLTFFAYANLIQIALSSILLLLIYILTAELKVQDWRFDYFEAKKLLSQGWIIYLGSIFAVIYLKVDQIMLRWLVGSEPVGIYAVAARLSESWYFVPTAIVASFFPKLILLRKKNINQFNMRLQQTFDILFILALLVACIMTFFSEPIIRLFFGRHYLSSAPILVIHIWTALFIFMRAALSKWILIEDVLIFSLITQGCGALANVGLNLWLIPKYGGIGAAVSTLISYAIASYFSLVFYKKSRIVFVMMSVAMLSPVRYPLAYIKGKCL